MSYTSQQFLVYDGSSLANFKAWAQAISNAFSGSGWTQTADTGQVNWSTIASVPTAGTWVYEIWQPGDALQTGASKFFVKFEYGINTSNGPRPRITIGSGTNGSGTITGFFFGPGDFFGSGGAGGTGSSIQGDCWFSGDTNRIGMTLWRSLCNDGYSGGIGSPTLTFEIERSHDVHGNDTAVAVNFICLTRANQARGMMSLVFGIGTCAPSHSDWDNGGCYPTVGWEWQNASALFNNGVPIYHVIPSYGVVDNPMIGAAFAHWQDVGECAQFSTQIYNASHNYVTTGLYGVSFPSQNQFQFCLRYE